MARLTRVATWRTHRIAGIVAVTALLAGACGDDDDQGAAPDDTVPASITTTTREVNFGGLEIPEIPGTFPAGLPSIGFGIAVPQGWQATVLTEEALERLRDATLNQPSFLDAAETVAAAAEPSGATVPSESRSVGSTVTAFPKSLECGDGSWRTRRIEGPSSTIATLMPSPVPPAAPPASSAASFAGVRRISAVSSHVPPRACTSSSNVARSPSSPTLS